MGGVRSGKSAFAEGLVKSLDLPTAYLATGMAIDAEMEQRIHLHRQGRPTHWVTVEEPLDLAGGHHHISAKSDVFHPGFNDRGTRVDLRKVEG